MLFFSERYKLKRVIPIGELALRKTVLFAAVGIMANSLKY